MITHIYLPVGLINFKILSILDRSEESTTPISMSQEISSPHPPKQSSPFYAEPADSLMPTPAPRKLMRPSEIPAGNSISPLQSFRLVNFRVKPDRDTNEGIN